MQSTNPQVAAAQLFAAPCRATEPQLQQFVRGLAAVMNQWTALHLVAQHCDPQAFHSLYEDLVEWHRRDGEVYSDEMELFFEDFFTSARSVVIEDDSMKEVADVLHDMYCRCCSDDHSRVEHFVHTETIYRRENPLALCVNAGGTGGNDNEEDFAGLTLDEAGSAGAVADGGDELVPGEANGEADADGNEEEEQQSARAPAQQPAKTQPPTNRRRKKNASAKGSGGWSVVL